jgi:hypothetical protein
MEATMFTDWIYDHLFKELMTTNPDIGRDLRLRLIGAISCLRECGAVIDGPRVGQVVDGGEGGAYSRGQFEGPRDLHLERIFLLDKSGRLHVYGGTEKFQTDSHWKDYILFHHYFHGDNGASLGASHQTGWTGVVAKLIELFGPLDGRRALDAGKSSAFAKGEIEEIENESVA